MPTVFVIRLGEPVLFFIFKINMNFLTLDLNLLRDFDAVMIEQNLTRAAEKLAMTQPAVSNALKRLRHAFNDELLIRKSDADIG